MSSDIDEEALRAYLPSGFGKQDTASNVNPDNLYAKFARAKETSKPLVSTDTDSDSSSDSDSGEELPITHEISFNSHKRQISGICADPSGARFVTTSYDQMLKLWDFNGMDPSNRNPFLSIEPTESHGLHQALFSSDSRLLVIPRYSRAKLYSHDGKELGQYAAGDMYLMDMRNTKGHVGEISQGQWNPSNSTFSTAGSDSTVRIWDSSKFNSQMSVIVLRNALKNSGPKTKATAVNWLTPSSLISASIDGALRVFDTRGAMLRPNKETLDAHVPNTWTSSILALSEHTLATRGGDGTVKLWDIRLFKKPLLTRSGLKTTSEELSLTRSPIGSENYLATGNGSQVDILDQTDLMTVESVNFLSDVTQVYWNHALNQIFVGLANGELNILFSREQSIKGAKLVVEKVPKLRHIDDNLTANISLHGLNQEIMDRENAAEALREQQRRDRLRAKQGLNQSAINPPKPHSGVWGVPDKKHLENNVSLSERISEDPREQLLTFADRAAKDTRFKSFQAQPKIYADDRNDDNSDEEANEPDPKRPKTE